MNVRLQDKPHDRMRELAELHRRSLHAEILTAIDEYIERHEQELTRKALLPRQKEK